MSLTLRTVHLSDDDTGLNVGNHHQTDINVMVESLSPSKDTSSSSSSSSSSLHKQQHHQQQHRVNNKLSTISRGIIAMNRLRNNLQRKRSIQDIVAVMESDRHCMTANTNHGNEDMIISTQKFVSSSINTLSTLPDLFDNEEGQNSVDFDGDKDDHSTRRSSTDEDVNIQKEISSTTNVVVEKVVMAPICIKKTVSWGMVQFRTYETVIGDNPSVSSGPPISLGWRYSNDSVLEPPDDCYNDFNKNNRAAEDRTTTGSQMSIDEYETIRISQRYVSIDQLILSIWEREQRLMDAGFARSELNKAITSVTQIKVSRATNAKLGFFEKGGFANLIQNRRLKTIGALYM